MKKKMIPLAKKDLVQTVTVKNIKRLKTIAIIVDNIEELLLIFVI